jgi:hypothetical protein
VGDAPVRGGGGRDRRRAAAGGWSLAHRHFFRQPGTHVTVTTAAFHQPLSVLVVGFSTGVFGLYELPDCSSIHTLRSVAALTHTHAHRRTHTHTHRRAPTAA